jgi:hypothetical protein
LARKFNGRREALIYKLWKPGGRSVGGRS